MSEKLVVISCIEQGGEPWQFKDLSSHNSVLDCLRDYTTVIESNNFGNEQWEKVTNDEDKVIILVNHNEEVEEFDKLCFYGKDNMMYDCNLLSKSNSVVILAMCDSSSGQKQQLGTSKETYVDVSKKNLDGYIDMFLKHRKGCVYSVSGPLDVDTASNFLSCIMSIDPFERAKMYGSEDQYLDKICGDHDMATPNSRIYLRARPILKPNKGLGLISDIGNRIRHKQAIKNKTNTPLYFEITLKEVTETSSSREGSANASNTGVGIALKGASSYKFGAGSECVHKDTILPNCAFNAYYVAHKHSEERPVMYVRGIFVDGIQRAKKLALKIIEYPHIIDTNSFTTNDMHAQ